MPGAVYNDYLIVGSWYMYIAYLNSFMSPFCLFPPSLGPLPISKDLALSFLLSFFFCTIISTGSWTGTLPQLWNPHMPLTRRPGSLFWNTKLINPAQKSALWLSKTYASPSPLLFLWHGKPFESWAHPSLQLTRCSLPQAHPMFSTTCITFFPLITHLPTAWVPTLQSPFAGPVRLFLPMSFGIQFL